MAIVINGSGTVTGLAVGGLPDGTVDAGTLATDSVSAVKIAANSVDSAELIDGAIDTSHLASGVGGKVLQCLHYSSTSSTSSTNNTVVIGTVSITKISSTSKLLITAVAYLGQKTTGNNTDGANPTLTLANGATEILKFYHADVPMWRTDAQYHGEYDTHPYFGSLLYSVAAGSHSIYLKLASTGDGVWVNRSAGASTGFGATGLTVMEIEV